MKYDAYIFDVDGVLIDTSHSFTEAVLHAVRVGTGSMAFTINELNSLKSIGGFNNDWFAAMAGAGWIQFCPDISFDEYVEKARSYDRGIMGVRQYIQEITAAFEASVKALVMEAYGGTTACKKLYGFEPQTIQIPGYWQTEKPLIPHGTLNQFKDRIGIVTGRNRGEIKLAFEILGCRLPHRLVAVSDDPNLDKPNPEKLIQIVDRLQSIKPIYFGDTRDDMELVRNYKRQTGRPMDFCLVGNELDLPDFGFKTDSVTNFLTEMELVHG